MATSARASITRGPAFAPAAAEAVAAELQALHGLDLGQLRVQYRNRTGRIAPVRISRALLLRVLAHQIQVEAFGDLSRDTRRMLDRLSTTEGQHKSVSDRAVNEVPFSLKPGTMLSREWQGRMEQVMALDEGFAWNGKAHASLSAVAFAITGTKWNGHRFFGLRDRQKDPLPINSPTERNSALLRLGPEPARPSVGGQP